MCSGEYEQAMRSFPAGHNQARATLTGSLVGAQVGLSGIPTRFLEGLNDCEELVSLTVRLALANPD
jgi:hypothetical protein